MGHRDPCFAQTQALKSWSSASKRRARLRASRQTQERSIEGGREEDSVAQRVHLVVRLAHLHRSEVQLPRHAETPVRGHPSFLGDLGFVAISTYRPRPESASPFDLITPIIGLEWLRLPRLAYPVRPVLALATKLARLSG